MRDHPDHLLPDRNFLRGHLARELLEQQQAVRLAVQRERPVAHVEHLGLAADLDREQRVHAALDRLPQRRGGLREQLTELQALDLAARGEELPRGDVAEDDRVAGIRQHQRERRRLHDRVEQELPLVQVEPFLAQAIAEGIVLAGEVADLVAGRGGDAHAEVAVLEAADAVGHRADAAAPAVERAPREPDRGRQRGQQRDRPCEQPGIEQAVEREGGHRHEHGRDDDHQCDAAGQRPARARLAGHQLLPADVRPGSTADLSPSFSMRR